MPPTPRLPRHPPEASAPAPPLVPESFAAAHHAAETALARLAGVAGQGNGCGGTVLGGQIKDGVLHMQGAFT